MTGVFSWYNKNMTVIMGNLKKKSEMIDPQGNIINPRTKQVIRSANEGDYQPTPEEMKAMFSKEPAPAVPELPKVEPKVAEESPLAAVIKAQVNKAVQEQIKSIDIGKMVAEAIKESFK